MAETAILEQVGFLAFSPLAAGLLTGKYQDDQIPDASRMTINPDLGGRTTPQVYQAVDGYLKVAQKHGLDPVQMALAFCLGRPFMTSVIFGATTLAQLELALGAGEMRLSPKVRDDIAKVHRAFPMPY